MSFNILVLHSDRSTGLNFVQCLQEAKKEGWGQDLKVVGLCSHPIRMQLCKNDITFVAKEHDGDLEQVVKSVEQKLGESVHLVYETKSAPHMLQVSQLRDRVPVFLPPHKMVEIFEDKYLTYKHLVNKGFPVPKTHLIKTPADIEAAFKDIAKSVVWVRDTQGQAGFGAFTATSMQQVVEQITQRNGWGHHTIAEKLPIDAVHKWEDRLSSNFLPGEMVTWIAFYNEGQLVASQARKRLYWEHSDLTTSGVTGYSGANMTVSRGDVNDLSDAIVRSFDWKPHGAMGADYVVDETGQIKLTEIQASRFFTSTQPLALLGLNFPKLYVDAFRGSSVCKELVNPCPEGMLYIQRFGSESMMVHRDTILSELTAGTSRPKQSVQSDRNSQCIRDPQ